MTNNSKYKIGEIIKQRRIFTQLTLYELSAKSGVSQSHIARIEKGERFPSAHVLQKIAEPLGFKAEDLFVLAGFLSDQPQNGIDSPDDVNQRLKLDPNVANLLSRESPEVQRAVLSILSLLKSIATYNEKPSEK